jgi:hypothetical protein
VTDVRSGQPGISYPRYIGGERNGPPEDCGGLPGFYELLEAIANPTHPSHAHLKEWAGDYDPDTFDVLPIKYALGRIANRRNAARSRFARKKPLGSVARPAAAFTGWLPFSGTVVIRSDHVVPRTPTFSVQTNELIFSVR